MARSIVGPNTNDTVEFGKLADKVKTPFCIVCRSPFQLRESRVVTVSAPAISEQSRITLQILRMDIRRFTLSDSTSQTHQPSVR